MGSRDMNTMPVARVWFVDVGAGDCTLVVDVASGRALLVDCPSTRVADVQSLLNTEGATLDTVIVTHWDLDHYGGASRLAVGLPVSKVLYNHDTLFPNDDSPPVGIRSTLKSFLDVPFANDVLGPASAGQSGTIGILRWEILAPTHKEITEAYTARRRNVASAVVDVRMPGLRILIGGDAVSATWDRLVRERELSSDVLRWPHHGADLHGDGDGAVRDSVLEAVQPKLVVISTGTENSYGHPSHRVITSASACATVLCTQVTSGCFGFISRDQRKSREARSHVEDLDTTHCAGTVCIDCWSDSYSIRPTLDEHDLRIRRWSQPMCRTSHAAAAGGAAIEVS
jgi:competence protein ComEC